MSDENPSVPYGYCHCGCGEKTSIASHSNREFGHIKGEPVRFVVGHNNRKHRPPADFPRARLCECGCGEQTPLATYTAPKAGVYEGFPLRFIRGHNGRLQPTTLEWDEQDRGYTTACWIWRGSLNQQGYGQLSMGGHHRAAHYVVWEMHRPAVSSGLVLDHLCFQPACVNPDHLEPVTYVENTRRRRTTKLSMQKVGEIRMAHGVSQVELAARFGVTASTIADVVHGRTWRE